MSRRWILWATATGVLTATVWIYLARLLADPSVPLLVPESRVQWIRFDRSMSLMTQPPGQSLINFRKRFSVRQPPARAVLTVRAFKGAVVLVDGRRVLGPVRDLDAWKKPLQVDLAPFLRPGSHQLAIPVLNQYGPPALLAYCESLHLWTGSDWEASRDGKSWTPARPVDAPNRPAFYSAFPTSLESLRASLPVLAPVFVVVFLVTLGWPRLLPRFPRLDRAALTPGWIRWALLGAYGLLWANDLLKVPVYVGFDTYDHLEYIMFVAQKWRIPLATYGWQMFQSPLYYLVSAPLYAVFSPLLQPEMAIRLLRVVPLACGMAQIQLNYLVARKVFPQRADLQGIATFLGGLLPINLYLSQALGNEPMAGALSTAVILATFSLDEEGRLRESTRPLLALGAWLGLALLAKVTAILLVPLVLIYAAHAMHAAGYPVGRCARGIVAILGVTFLVAGWYYLRNWIELGKPFIGGWETRRGMEWWQDPGYRTPRQFVTFGASLVRPLYAGTDRFWDSFYSTLWSDAYLSGIPKKELWPPWNYDFLIAGPLLALVPTAAMLAGMARALRRAGWPHRKHLLFAASAVSVYVAATLHLFLALPIYSTVKATYTIGILSCYCVLGAAGFRLLLRTPLVRATVYGLLGCWGLSAYLAYFVR